MPRSFPTPWIAYMHRYDGSAVNDEERTIDTWNPPKNVAGTPFRVIGWAPVVAQEVEANRPIIRYELFLPPTIRHAVSGIVLPDPAPRDVIDLPENNVFGIARFEVQAWPRDYTKGFHGWEAGKVVDLQRT